jgi:hypothetical protein
MTRYKAIRNQDADYIIDNKKMYAVEYASIDKHENVIDYGIDYDSFESEEEAENHIKKYNNPLD